MARITGRIGAVQVSDDGGATFSDLGCIVDMTLNGALAEIDSTCHGEDDRTWLAGRRDFTLDLSLHWDELDAGQIILEAAFLAASTLDIRYKLTETTGDKMFTGSGFITAYSPTSPNDDVADLDVSLRLSGALVATTVP